MRANQGLRDYPWSSRTGLGILGRVRIYLIGNGVNIGPRFLQNEN